MTRTLLTEPSPPLDRQTAWIFGGIFLLVLVFIIIIPVFCVAHPALPPVAQFSLPAVPFWRCAIPISPPPSLFSCQLLYYSLHVSRTPLFLSSGSAILTGTGRRLHRACSSATNSQTSEPSGKEASLHVTANACFLFLSLQNSFQNSWLPSFRWILPGQYFKNVLSFSSPFCPAWVIELPLAFSPKAYHSGL